MSNNEEKLWLTISMGLKLKIIINSGELTYLDYLPTKQKVQNISRTQTGKPLVF